MESKVATKENLINRILEVRERLYINKFRFGLENISNYFKWLTGRWLFYNLLNLLDFNFRDGRPRQADV